MNARKTSDPLNRASRFANNVIPHIAERSRPLVVIAILVAAVLSGPVVIGDSMTRGLAVVGLVTAMVALSVVASRIAQESMVTDNPADVRRAVESTNGVWWQRVYDHERRPIGLTVLHIELSVVGTANRMFGSRYDSEGRHVFDWRTTALAFEDVSNLVFFYAWEGSHTRTAGTISGIGSYTFFSANGRADVGHGWFVTGDLNRLTFNDENSSVLLRRVTDDEAAIIAQGGAARAEMIRDVFAGWETQATSRSSHPSPQRPEDAVL